MKIEIEKETLVNSLNWSTRVLAPRPILPVLLAVKLGVSKDGFTTEVSNLEVSAKTSELVAAQEEGEVLVPGKVFTDMVKALKDGKVLLETAGNKLKIEGGKTKYQLSVMENENFPEVSASVQKIGLVAAAEFSRAIQQVSVAAAHEEATPVLTAVKVDLKDSEIVLSAIDRYRIARKVLPWKSQGLKGEMSLLIKAKTLLDLIRNAENKETIEIAVAETDEKGKMKENIAQFTAGGYSLTTQLMSGEFPQTAQLFEQQYTSQITIEKRAFESGINQVLAVGDGGGNVTLTIDNNAMTIQAGDGDEKQGTTEVECQYSGPEIVVRFNSTFLKEGVSQIHEDSVLMMFEESTKPVQLHGISADGKKENTDYQYLIVPIRGL